MRPFLLVSILFLASALGPLPSWGSAPRVRLLTWNVHNLFDERDDPYRDTVLTPDQVERKLNQLGAILNGLEADVIALQEVENRALLERLAARIPGIRHTILVVGNDEVRGIQVGLLSRQSVVGYRTHRDDLLENGGRFSRDCLEVHLGGTLPMVVLVNHFKSKVGGPKRSDAPRHAQARGVRDIVRSLERWRAGLKIAVMGDLNDELTAPTLEPLSDLIDPLSRFPRRDRFTSKHGSKLIAIDHILVNRALAPHLCGSGVWHRREVEKASDHYPVWVDVQP